MRLFYLSLTLTLAISLSGCALIFGGSTKTITVNSSPPGAVITTSPAMGQFTTPTAIELDRKNSYTVMARLEGYSEAQAFIRQRIRVGMMILDILAGAAWLIIDFVTGAIYDLTPDQLQLFLQRLDPTVDGPDIVTVTLLPAEAKGGGLRLIPQSSVDGVEIEIIKHER